MKTAFFQMVTVPICVKKTVEEGDSFSYKKLMCWVFLSVLLILLGQVYLVNSCAFHAEG